MKIISSKIHGLLDYATVLFLFASPQLFNMDGSLSTITYVLACVQLLLNLLTAYEFGVMKSIPFRIHGLIEIITSIILAAIAFWFNNDGDNTGFYFYLILAVIYVFVFVLTDFTSNVNSQNKQ